MTAIQPSRKTGNEAALAYSVFKGVKYPANYIFKGVAWRSEQLLALALKPPTMKMKPPG
jgi:hypothetical protein